MSKAAADRNLLFGILALQMDFIDKDALVAAMNAWVLNKARPLGQVLVDQGALGKARYALLDPLVEEHVRRHGNDPEKSLQALSSAGGVREELRRVADPEVQASLAHVPAAPKDRDIYATRSQSVGLPTSSGLRFRILRPHARGGLGQVSVARDEELGREVALKEIQERHADDPNSRARFLLEAEITGSLEHPGIVPVYGLGRYEDGRPFYAMRFIRGDSLKDAIERFHQADVAGRDPGKRALELRALLGRFIDVCNAIAYAHSRGVLHRDLKPGNVMLGRYGETLVVDWGLAKALDPARGPAESVEGPITPASASLSAPTLMGAAVGTPQYMSPEQAAGRLDQLGPASDVYSLGATLYCLLTGKAPIDSRDVGEVLQKVQRGDFPPPRQVKPSVPRALEAICRKAMALRPGDRYVTPRALADDIEHWLADEPVSAWHEPWTVRAQRWLRRHRTLATGAAAVVLVATLNLAAATALLTAANDREHRAKELALQNEREAREQRDEAQKQKAKAERNYRLARQAVDRYHTEVSESVLLHEPGMQPLRKKLLEAAREFYEKFVQERGLDPGVQGELGKALFRLAQITGDIDSPLKAIDLHQQARTIFAALDAGAAAGPATKKDLAACQHHLGRLYRLTDQPARAEASYQKALGLWEQLVRDQPRSADNQAALARSRLGLGNAYQVARRLDLAQAAYEKALAAWANLTRAYPDVPEHQRDLAVAHSNLAMVLAATGQAEKATANYRQAVTIQDRLVRNSPDISQYQNDLARTQFNLGDLCSLSGRREEAEGRYQEAEALWKALAAKHPAVTDFQTNLAEAYAGLAAVHLAAGQTVKAEETCRQALAIKLKLAQAYKGLPAYQGDLARGYFQLGDVFRAGRQAARAETAYADAVRIQEKLAGAHPSVPHYRADLARSYNNLGLLHQDGKHRDRAEDAFRQALASWQRLAEAHPRELEFALGLGTTCCNLGNLEASHNNARAALDWYGRAIRALEAAGPAGHRDTAARQGLGNAHWKRAEALTQLGRHADALADWDRALEWSAEASRPWCRLYRALTLARLGEHARATTEARALTEKAAGSGEALYHLACVLAVSAGFAERDGKLAPDERRRLAEQYTAAAVELLTKARGTAWFQVAANRALLTTNPDLARLRDREAFKKLLSAAEDSARAKAGSL